MNKLVRNISDIFYKVTLKSGFGSVDYESLPM